MPVTLHDLGGDPDAKNGDAPDASPHADLGVPFQRFELIDRVNNMLMVSTKDSLYGHVQELISEIFESPYGFFGYVDGGGNLNLPALPDAIWEDGAQEAAPQRFPRDEWPGLWGEVLQGREGKISNGSHRIVDGQREVARAMAAPIVLQGRLLGAVVAAGRDREYAAEDLKALDMMASHIAPVLSGILEEEQRLSAQAALTETDAAIKVILDTAVDAIIAVTADGTIRLVSEAASRQFGYSAEELLGQNLKQLLPQINKEERDENLNQFEQSGDGRVFYESEETIGRRRDGTLFPVEMSVGVAKIRGEELYIGVIRDITVRKIAEDELRRSEKRFRTLVDTMNEGFIHQDASGKLAYVNKRFCDLLGYSEEELTGKPLLNLVDDDHKANLRQRMTREAGLSTDRLDIALRTKTGNRVPVVISPRPVVDEAGEPAGSFAVVTDLTEYMAAAAELARQGAEHRAVIETMAEGFAAWDTSAMLTYVNARFRELLGYTDEELVGRSLLDFVVDEDKEAAETRTTDAEASAADRYELILRTRDGGEIPVLVSAQPKVDESGKFAGSLAVVADLTDHKAAIAEQADLAAEQAREGGHYRSLLETLGEGLVSVDPAGTLTYVNAQFRELLGYGDDELIGRPFLDRVADECKETAEVRTTGAEASATDRYELVLSTKDGGLVPVLLSPRPIVDGSGEFAGWFAVVADLTDQKVAIAEQADMAAEMAREGGVYRTMIETMGEGVASLDAAGNLVRANARLCTLLGYADEHLVGRPFLDFVTDDQKDLARRHLAADAMAAAERYELTLCAKSGDEVHVLVSPRPIVEDGGEVVGSVVVVTDITERVMEAGAQAEAAEASSMDADRYRLLIETVSDGVVHGDAQGTIVYANPRMGEMLGCGHEELVGLSLSRLVADDFREDFTEKFAGLDSGAAAPFELAFNRKDGTTCQALVTPTPVMGADGAFEGTITVVAERPESGAPGGGADRAVGPAHDDALIEAMNDGYIRLDDSGIIGYANARICESLDYSDAEMAGRPMWDLVVEDGRSRFESLLDACRDGRADRSELRLKTADGAGRTLHVTMQGVFDDAGDYQGAFAILQDVSDQKSYESELQEAQACSALFQAVTNAVGDATTVEQAVQICVDEFCKHTGWPVAHVVLPAQKGSSVLLPSLIWHMADDKRFEKFRDATGEARFGPGIGLPGRVLQGGEPVWITDIGADGQFRRKDVAREAGLRSALAFPIVVDNEIVAVIECFSERSAPPSRTLLETVGHIGFRLGRAIERKSVEIRIQDSMARFRNLAEGSIQGMLIHKDWNLLYVNQALADILGYANPEEVLSHKRLEQLFPGAELERIKAMSAQNDGGPSRYEVRYRRKDGQTVWIENLVRPVEWEGQTAVQVTLVDIDERKKAEMVLAKHAGELTRSNQELDDFAYVASHDLKAPLRGIHNYANFLLEDYGGKLDTDGVDKLQTLTRLSKKMEDIIDDLLTYSRVGRTALDLKPVDLNRLVAEVRDQIAVYLQENRVELRLAQPLPTVTADQMRVRAVFHNLITNGAKYSDSERKWVEVGFMADQMIPGAESGTTETVFYVRDNGIGIRQKHFEKIFGMFRRLHAGDKYGGGTGAGLSIVKKIIDQHGGRIWVESEYGRGTTFYFTLGNPGAQAPARSHAS